MRGFMRNCRCLAVAAGAIILGTVLIALPTGKAQAQNVDEWINKSFAKSEQGRKANRRMSLGAGRSERPRESLTGGSRRITSGKNRRRTATANNRRRQGVRTASLGESYAPRPEVGPSLAGRGVKWVASSGCLDARLRAIVYQVASNFGPVTVNSTCRGRRHNARVGGARQSYHLSGSAVDFRVHGRGNRGVYAYLRSLGSVGGLKLYSRGFFHIDTGPRRTW